ncbi:MAG: 6,7-dimethyl-8-ribityllumazine synthase [Pseudomonadota bacterium]
MAEQSDTDPLPLPTLDPAPKLMIVCAPFYRTIADNLIAGASEVLKSVGAGFDLLEVPGALEIPTAIRIASEGQGYEGYVALGCIIRGETTHYETVCEESARGITLLGVQQGLCIGNGILTVENAAQANVRADPQDHDKGGGAAKAALHLIALARRVRGAPAPAFGGSGAAGTAYAGALPTRTA